MGPNTYVPEGLLEIPPKLTLDEARKESSTVLFGAVDELLEKTGVKVKDIGILVVNCCLFNPTPSLSDIIVNHYKLRGNVLVYNLSGMGCSAGVLAVDFAKQLLQVRFPLILSYLFFFCIYNIYIIDIQSSPFTHKERDRKKELHPLTVYKYFIHTYLIIFYSSITSKKK